MVLKLHDSMLPQYDEDTEQRKAELEAKRKVYQFDMSRGRGMMPLLTECPSDEEFSHQYQVWK